jgi:hypothetical protein
MTNEIALSAVEFTALVSVDGTSGQPQMPPEIKTRLTDLQLVERREWPNGPLCRTAIGNRRVRGGK